MVQTHSSWHFGSGLRRRIRNGSATGRNQSLQPTAPAGQPPSLAYKTRDQNNQGIFVSSDCSTHSGRTNRGEQRDFSQWQTTPHHTIPSSTPVRPVQRLSPLWPSLAKMQEPGKVQVLRRATSIEEPPLQILRQHRHDVPTQHCHLLQLQR